MAGTQNTKTVNLVVGEDLNGDFAQALTIDSDGRVIKASAATSVIVGFLAEDPGRTTVDGVDSVPVTLIGGGGVGKAVAVGAITAGNIIIPTTTAGLVDGAANIAALIANQMGVGYALEAATAANDVIEVLMMPVSGPNA